MDVIGLVTHVGELEGGEVVVDALPEDTEDDFQQNIPKREVIICDQAGIPFPVILWSYNAEEFTAVPGTIVAFRNSRVIERSEWILEYLYLITNPPSQDDGGTGKNRKQLRFQE